MQDPDGYQLTMLTDCKNTSIISTSTSAKTPQQQDSDEEHEVDEASRNTAKPKNKDKKTKTPKVEKDTSSCVSDGVGDHSDPLAWGAPAKRSKGCSDASNKPLLNELESIIMKSTHTWDNGASDPDKYKPAVVTPSMKKVADKLGDPSQPADAAANSGCVTKQLGFMAKEGGDLGERASLLWEKLKSCKVKLESCMKFLEAARLPWGMKANKLLNQ